MSGGTNIFAAKKSARMLLIGASVFAIGACSFGGAQSYSNLPYSSGNNPQETGPSTPSGLRAVADDLASNGQVDAALPLYRTLAANTNSPADLTALGEALSGLGLHDEAASIYSKALDKDATYGPAWYGIGRSQLSQGRFEEALAAFSEAQNYGESRAGSGRGIALAALGQTSNAISAFDANNDTVSRSNKALLMAATGNSSVAVTILEPLVASGEGTPRDRQNLAMAYLMDGREGDAFRMARLDLDPVTVQETFTFYREIMSIPADQRMRALVTGTIDPDWGKSEAGNLVIVDTDARQFAAKRIVEGEPKPVLVAEAPKPEPVPAAPEPQTEPVEEDRSNYELTTIPPLVEPYGYALQIGAYRNLENLMRGWTILYRQSGDLLKDIPPRRSEVDHGSKDDGPRGFYYRLNAGPLKTFAEARDLCSALKERGTDCWVRPPEVKEGQVEADTESTD
jgi:Flp pilus assembly protein TadD